MYDGSRVTDAVEYWKRREQLKKAVGIVRTRSPERFRWRRAVVAVTESAGVLRGRDRMSLEEPIRELVLDLDDNNLRREIVLDARRVGVDLDRGEVLPTRTLGELALAAERAGTIFSRVSKHMKLPTAAQAPVDVAGAVVVGRALGEHFKVRSQRLLLQVPQPDGPEKVRYHHELMLARAAQDRDESQRWFAFARLLIEPGEIA